MHSKTILAALILIFVSCNKEASLSFQKTESKELQALLDSAKVNGAILIFDFNKNTYYANNFEEAKKSAIPASTYKIPHTIIGLETGELKDEKTIFVWDGKAKRMNENLSKLHFGEMHVTEETIANFWLTGESKINPFQQIDFLKRLYNKELPISEATYKAIKNILIIEDNKDFTLSGKTGLSIGDKETVGWFVGYLEKGKQVCFFTTKISPKEKEMSAKEFSPIRKAITLAALKELNIME